MSKESDRLDEIERIGSKFKGGKELKSYLTGEVLSAKGAVIAKCYDCMGYYADGAIDCKVPTCPLYLYMPYSEVGPRKQKRGKMSPERKEALLAGLKKAREARK